MTEISAAFATIPFQAGEPIEHRGVIVLPPFPLREPSANYLALDEALERGLRITELSDAGSVPEIGVVNLLDDDVLLYDGEELVGAKQNRILNVSVLVGAGTTLPIPVSCTEHGRWRSVSTAFSSGGHMSHPELRRQKAEWLHGAPLARGAAQSAVWAEVDAKTRRLGHEARSNAMHDAYAAHRARLEEVEGAFPLQPGQCGAVLALGDTLCLDAVSQPAVFSLLWPKIRAGYMLDAIEHIGLDTVPAESLLGFLDRVAEAPTTRGPSAGLGKDVRLRGPGVIGSALELDGEVLQLSAFSSDGDGPAATRPGRIARPGRLRG